MFSTSEVRVKSQITWYKLGGVNIILFFSFSRSIGSVVQKQFQDDDRKRGLLNRKRSIESAVYSCYYCLYVSQPLQSLKGWMFF